MTDSPATSRLNGAEAMDDCIEWMGQMSWPTSMISKETLIKMRNEWHPRASAEKEEQHARLLGPGLSREETLRQLQDPGSEMAKMLTELGWSAPSTSASTSSSAPALLPMSGPNMPTGLTPLPWDTSIPAFANMDAIDRECSLQT